MLKSIRLELGISQEQAANFLAITKRNYQYLESKKANTNTEKYKVYLEKLKSYKVFDPNDLKTNAILGNDLKKLISNVKHYKTRYSFDSLTSYFEMDNKGKVCILYGLRRTGKTTMLYQLLSKLNLSKTVYMKVNEKNTMADLVKDINTLKERGIINYLIDEVTLLEDFIDSASTLSDIYSMSGLKIVLSGTDSLGFYFSDKDELFDRNIMIHTSYISFKEFYDVLGIKDIDKYIEYGGTLKIENMDFSDPDYQKDEVAFRNDESTRKYIDTSICRNIQRTLVNSKLGSTFIHLRELYEKNELTNAINRIIQSMNHEFLESVILERFKSSDLGSAKQLLLNNENPIIQTALFDINNEKVVTKLKELIEIKEKEDLLVDINPLVLAQIKSYLYALDLIRDVDIVYEDGHKEKRVVFTQPGMRYSITKALVYSLMNDSYFLSINYVARQTIIEKILSDVKGRMLEDIVLLEKSMKAYGKKLVFKYVSFSRGEFDLVIFDKIKLIADVFEVKYSKNISYEGQTKFLRNESLIDSLEQKYGMVLSRNVLYRGEPKEFDLVNYINVEDYLIN